MSAADSSKTCPAAIPAWKKVVATVLSCAAAALTYKPFTFRHDRSLDEDRAVAISGLPNLHIVHNYLLRGGAPTAEGLEHLRAMGVKTIIDFRVNPQWVEREKEKSQALGMNYINLPTGNFIPSLAKQKVFFDVLDRASHQEAGTDKVFVHCAHGTDRTGFMVALWRVNREQWSWAEALSEMMRYGFLIHKWGYAFSPLAAGETTVVKNAPPPAGTRM